MKKILFSLIMSLYCITADAQTFHNYFNTQFGYVQIGFFNSYILFRIPSGNHIPFSPLNYIGTQDNLAYYANEQIKVVVNNRLSQVCVIDHQYEVWYNYVGSISAQVPNNQLTENNNTTQLNKQKCYFCNGTGRIAKNDRVPQYTSNDYVVKTRCEECGLEYYSTYTNHYHLTCGQCGGSGYMR